MGRISYVELATRFIENRIEKNLNEFNRMGKTYGEKVENFCLELGEYWFDLVTSTFKMKSITGDDVENMNPNFVKFMDKVIDNITDRRRFKPTFDEVISAEIKLCNKVKELDYYCDNSIDEYTIDEYEDRGVFTISFIGQTEVVETFYDIASNSVVIKDIEGEELYTTFEDFTGDFIKFCRNKFGEDYTQDWNFGFLKNCL